MWSAVARSTGTLDRDPAWGLQEGEALARRRDDLTPIPAPAPLHPFPTNSGLCIALVSQCLPPRVDAGIARWTALVARGLAQRGHQMHVLTGIDGAEYTRYEDGLWLHAMRSNPGDARALTAALGLQPNIAARKRRDAGL